VNPLALLVLRAAVGAVFLLFGVDKCTHPERWIVFVEGGLVRWIQATSPIDLHSVLRVQGTAEVLSGALLVAGAATRFAASFGAFVMLAVVLMLGFDPIAIRDLGLLGSLVCLVLTGAGRWSVDARVGPRVRGVRELPHMRKRILVYLPGGLLSVTAIALLVVFVSKRGTTARPEPEPVTVASLTNAAIVGREPVQPLPDPEPLDPARVALGNKLFHDTRLSRDNTIACASCHDLARGGADARSRSVGVSGLVGDVNSPTVFNARFAFKQFWDGRAENLLEQVNGPVENHKEMSMTWPEIVAALQSDPDYARAFQSAYAEGMNADNLRDAIVTFEMSLVTPNSRFDRWLKGDQAALTADEVAGYKLFKSIGCVVCHEGKLLGGNMFQTMGKMADYFQDRGQVTQADWGRYNVTKQDDDRYKFKVPTLRNVALTAPYFHDGSAATLADAVQIMSKYQLGLQLSAAEVDLLVKYLNTLTGEYRGQAL